ncbi:MAG: TRAP transporter small permease [Phycisphaerae bacterium]|nr:TRAP transporter small permease [Phycisphaerae bacterium]
MRYLELFSRRLNGVLFVLGGVAVLLLMLLSAASVLFGLAGVSIPGIYELAGFLGAAVIALALGYTQAGKDHIEVDVITRRYPEGLKRVIDVAKYIATIAFFGIVARQLWLWAMTLRRSGELSETLKLAFYPFVLCVALGFGAMALTLLVDLLKTIRPGRGESA